MRALDIPEISKLSTSEKLLLVEDLWDTISVDESVVPVPVSHKKELDRRLNQMESARLISLEELRARIDKGK